MFASACSRGVRAIAGRFASAIPTMTYVPRRLGVSLRSPVAVHPSPLLKPWS
jgi:hypothetical protein